LEIPFSRRRLDRILDLIRECQYSIHDLSRVQLDNTAPRTPRFNMPFELGLAVGLPEKIGEHRHNWIVCEAVPYRLQKSLSDLSGTDVYIHDGTIRGVFREMCNAFVRSSRQPTAPQMATIYRIPRKSLKSVLRRAGTRTPFNARVFKELCVLASAAASQLVD